MTALIDQFITDVAAEEQLDLEGFIAELRKNPNDWNAFRHAELSSLVRLIVAETVVAVGELGADQENLTDEILHRLYKISE